MTSIYDVEFLKTATPQSVQEQIDAGYDLEKSGLAGHTPLYKAVMNGASPEVVKTLLEAGADPNIKDFYGPFLIVDACIRKSEDIPLEIQEQNILLLLQYGAQIGWEQTNPHTGNSWIEPHQSNPPEMDTCLTAVVRWTKNVQLVKALIEAGVPINTPTENAQTALTLCKHEVIENVLLGNDAEHHFPVRREGSRPFMGSFT